ncbi:MAG: 30S ribosomal protein S18 [bacterium]|nr:30S ribosomal protein S18 [bacterium]
MTSYKNRKCRFCEDQIGHIDYKNTPLIRQYLTRYAKIVPRYYSGCCLKHQKKLSRAIKNSREMALLPYTK